MDLQTNTSSNQTRHKCVAHQIFEDCLHHQIYVFLQKQALDNVTILSSLTQIPCQAQTTRSSVDTHLLISEIQVSSTHVPPRNTNYWALLGKHLIVCPPR